MKQIKKAALLFLSGLMALSISGCGFPFNSLVPNLSIEDTSKRESMMESTPENEPESVPESKPESATESQEPFSEESREQSVEVSVEESVPESKEESLAESKADPEPSSKAEPEPTSAPDSTPESAPESKAEVSAPVSGVAEAPAAEPVYLLNEVKPYKNEGKYTEGGVFSMGGKEYTHGFVLDGRLDWEYKLFFNMEGKYDKLSFTSGIVEDYSGLEVAILTDGEQVYHFEMKSGDLPTDHTVDISGCKQLIIYAKVYAGWTTCGFAEVMVEPSVGG